MKKTPWQTIHRQNHWDAKTKKLSVQSNFHKPTPSGTNQPSKIKVFFREIPFKSNNRVQSNTHTHTHTQKTVIDLIFGSGSNEPSRVRQSSHPASTIQIHKTSRLTAARGKTHAYKYGSPTRVTPGDCLRAELVNWKRFLYFIYCTGTVDGGEDYWWEHR